LSSDDPVEIITKRSALNHDLNQQLPVYVYNPSHNYHLPAILGNNNPCTLSGEWYWASIMGFV